jgi:phosphoribosylformylglycinamidine synthase
VLKPLAGAAGDAPQDGAVLRIDGSSKLMAMGCALLPELGKKEPFAMGRAVVDECVRQLVAMGSDPDRLAILDNFCVGNPEDERELGALVECTKGMAQAAIAYGAPFVSGKDSFYNYFITDEGPVSIPVTLLVSGLGIVDDISQVVGASQRRIDSKICVLGRTRPGLRGSVLARHVNGCGLDAAPAFDEAEAMAGYRAYHQLVKQGAVLSAHDVGEGGLAVALAEMAFSGKAGIRVDLDRLPVEGECTVAELMFGETPARLLVEVAVEHLEAARAAGLVVIGESTREPWLHLSRAGSTLVDVAAADLKAIWKGGLTAFY